jgi:hypothetical protein
MRQLAWCRDKHWLQVLTKLVEVDTLLNAMHLSRLLIVGAPYELVFVGHSVSQAVSTKLATRLLRAPVVAFRDGYVSGVWRKPGSHLQHRSEFQIRFFLHINCIVDGSLDQRSFQFTCFPLSQLYFRSCSKRNQAIHLQWRLTSPSIPMPGSCSSVARTSSQKLRTCNDSIHVIDKL